LQPGIGNFFSLFGAAVTSGSGDKSMLLSWSVRNFARVLLRRNDDETLEKDGA
jgi:hypothetical protein